MTPTSRCGSSRVGGDQHGAAVQGAAEHSDGFGHDGVVQRVSRGEQVGAGLAFGLDVLEVEGDPIVLGGDGLRACWREVGGHVGDLIAAMLALAMRPPSRMNAALNASSM